VFNIKNPATAGFFLPVCFMIESEISLSSIKVLQMKYFGFITKVCAALMLAAGVISSCGGNGGYSGKKAQFVDSVVIGISYSTSSYKSGITDANGKFSFKTGDTVTFSIGEIVLPSGIPQDTSQGNVITPAHLAGNAEWETDVTAINIIRFLLTIDEDGDADNGIQIPAEAAELAYKAIDFSDTAAFDLEAAAFFEDLRNENELFEFIEIVTEEAAIEHFSATIKALDIEIEIQVSEEAVACNSTNTADIQSIWTGTLTDNLGDPSYVGLQTITVDGTSLAIGDVDIASTCTYQRTNVSEPVELLTDTWVWTDGADTYTLTTNLEDDTSTFVVAENNGLDRSSGAIAKDL